MSIMDNWIKRKIGLPEEEVLTREKLEAYQLKKLVDTLILAKESSGFYKNLLKDINPGGFETLKDIELVPLTSVRELRESGQDMLCVRPTQISRIVTLETSGTTGNPKRVYYTEEDQELTVDYFHNGMQNLVDSKDVVLILLPCARPGSVGDLLASAMNRLGAKPVPYGLLPDDSTDKISVLELILKEKITSIVGSPTQVGELAKFTRSLAKQGEWQLRLRVLDHQIKSVLLSTEYVPDKVCRFINQTWNCKVFEHYGMTEMGLGGAVSCPVLEGYHPREADLYFEIIDPETGQVVPEGEYGEVVFTTLTRQGMPFIRYRTGDMSRWLTAPCPCGSILKRLDKVGDRQDFWMRSDSTRV